jgi:8-oxo-dGTP pyrophosphatase MutT (NUDIX family)
MASLGLGNYVAAVLPIGGSKTYDFKHVSQHEPRTWFPAGSILPNGAPVDAAVRELFEENGLTLTSDDLTMLSGNPVRVPLQDGRHQLVHVFRHQSMSRACLPTFVRSYWSSKPIRSSKPLLLSRLFILIVLTPFRLPSTLTECRLRRLKLDLSRKYELLHFGSVAQGKS